MGFKISKLKKTSYDNTPKWDLKNKTVYAKVVKVYDGDTIWVTFYLHNKIYKFNIRLYGIDTPEIKPPKNQENRDEEIVAAKRSKKYLENLILDKIVVLELLGKDKYGRILAKVFIKSGILCFSNKINVISDMINKGYGYEYYGKTKKKYIN